MRPLLFVLATVLMLVPATHAARAELRLVMFQQEGCIWCALWRKEVGVIYPKTDEGKRAPLLVLDLYEPVPENLKIKSKARFTPTFVLVKDGVEQSRIVGYPGEAFFWGMLDRMLEDVDRKEGGS